MPSKAINNDNNNDPTSNREEEKQPLVENKQSEEQLQIGQDFETEVLEEKDDEMISSLTPTKRKGNEQLSKAKGNKKKGKGKRLVKHSSKLAETRLTSDLKRELAKQASNIDQITKILKPLQKYTTMTERQSKSIKQIEVQIKQLQKQTFNILKAIHKIK
ncbi:MAG: hypothetical protein WCA39_11730 [Nitrososphaeraceae archaeon]|jgi:hypothetical protein